MNLKQVWTTGQKHVKPTNHPTILKKKKNPYAHRINGKMTRLGLPRQSNKRTYSVLLCRQMLPSFSFSLLLISTDGFNLKGLPSLYFWVLFLIMEAKRSLVWDSKSSNPVSENKCYLLNQPGTCPRNSHWLPVVISQTFCKNVSSIRHKGNRGKRSPGKGRFWL